MIVAVDTGGTKTLVAVFDAKAGTIIRSDQFPTPKDTTAYISQVTQSIKTLAEGETPQAISVAVPGPVRDGIVIFCINLGWSNFAIQGELKKEFPYSHLFIDNDANLGGVGEARRRDPVPHKCLYITLGTGIGSGFIANGAVIPELADSEAGHMLLDTNTTWEQQAGGIRLLEEFGPIGEIHDPATLEEIGRRVARGLLVLLPTFRPDIVIIGGGIGAHYQRFSHIVEAEIQKISPFDCLVIQATNPKEAVVYGCYFVATDALAHL